jgi:hypothetical protein
MRKDLSEKIKEVCKLEWREDPQTGWKLVIDELNPACKKSLEKVIRNLGPHSKKYLSKRIETGNPEVKKTLKEIGL